MENHIEYGKEVQEGYSSSYNDQEKVLSSVKELSLPHRKIYQPSNDDTGNTMDDGNIMKQFYAIILLSCSTIKWRVILWLILK